MIETDVSVEPLWPRADWQAVCGEAVSAALNTSPYKALLKTQASVSISIAFADNAQVHKLNRDYRDKNKPTNILSFPMMEADVIEVAANKNNGEVLLGDMILAYEICAAEAAEKGVPLSQHVTHLIIHGTLHLIGFDHIDDAEAEHMEALEVKALASMGLANPYSE